MNFSQFLQNGFLVNTLSQWMTEMKINDWQFDVGVNLRIPLGVHWMPIKRLILIMFNSTVCDSSLLFSGISWIFLYIFTTFIFRPFVSISKGMKKWLMKNVNTRWPLIWAVFLGKALVQQNNICIGTDNLLEVCEEITTAVKSFIQARPKMSLPLCSLRLKIQLW